MPTLPTPTRPIKATLYRVGGLSINQLNATPPEFASMSSNYLVGSPYIGGTVPPIPTNPTPAFTHPDAGTIAVGSFDELVIDTQPTIDEAGNVTTATPAALVLYRQLGLSVRPFWLAVRCDGYEQLFYSNRANALAVAQSVVSSLILDMQTYLPTAPCMGFAFVNADLNVVFPDGSVIDRLFQSTLVQAAHGNMFAAMMITARPADHISLIGPTIANNPNSGLALAFPILGTSPAFQDRLTVVYPNVVVNYPNISTIAAQVQSFYSMRGRDGGFPLNIAFGYVIPFDATLWSPDGVCGLLLNPGAEKNLYNLSNFLATLGVQYVGLQSGPVGSVAPNPAQWLPTTGVNTSGASSVWTHDGKVFVSYLGSNGVEVVSEFNPDFTQAQ